MRQYLKKIITLQWFICIEEKTQDLFNTIYSSFFRQNINFIKFTTLYQVLYNCPLWSGWCGQKIYLYMKRPNLVRHALKRSYPLVFQKPECNEATVCYLTKTKNANFAASNFRVRYNQIFVQLRPSGPKIWDRCLQVVIIQR